MWLLFAAIVELGLLIDYKLNFTDSMFFLLRSLIGNSLVFYFFFYFILPKYILREKILLSFLLTYLSFLTWQLNNYLFILLASKYAQIHSAGLRSEMEDVVRKGILYLFTLHSISGGLIVIIYSISPIFCIKIVVSVIRELYKTLLFQKEKNELEIKFLKSQLNPHFLFNILNTIYILTIKKDPKASDVVLELSDMLRYTLYESNSDQVPLTKEIAFLEHYVNLEKARQNESVLIKLTWNIAGMENKVIAPLLMFPFVENAFKHGLGTSLKNGQVVIDTKLINDRFYFSIINTKSEENNGERLNADVGGIGVLNTQKRLLFIYPDKHVLKIVNNPTEYKIFLEINLD